MMLEGKKVNRTKGMIQLVKALLIALSVFFINTSFSNAEESNYVFRQCSWGDSVEYIEQMERAN